MSRAILRLLLCCALTVPLLVAGQAQARTMQARIARVTLPMTVLTGVRVRLDWPAQSPQGRLQVVAARIDAPGLGYRFDNVTWQCPVSRVRNRWRCEGPVRSGRHAPLRLGIDLDAIRTDIRLSDGRGTLKLQRGEAAGTSRLDLTRLDLTRVPAVWAQALLAEGWSDGRIKAGTIDGKVLIMTPQRGPLQIVGPLQFQNLAFDTADGTIAGENVAAQLDIDVQPGDTTRVAVDGHLHGGQMLFGNAYVSLEQRNVAVNVQALQHGTSGWQFPKLHWHDPGILRVDAKAALDTKLQLHALDLHASSENLAPVRDSYLTGFLGLAGLAELQLQGAADARLRIDGGVLRAADFILHAVTLDDPTGRFTFDKLDGDVRFSAADPVNSEVSWLGGSLHGLDFGPARLPFESGQGALRLREAVTMALLGGNARFDHFELTPPAAGEGLRVRFGMDLQQLDVGQISAALGWPAFTGELSGHIPEAIYANDRLDFGGGLAMQVFGGYVQVSSLEMERPFGVAPTLTSDITFDNLDLEALTGVMGFGTITGKLDGRIDDLRLLDWQAVAFDAWLQTDRAAARAARVRQRISQRAVQDLSSVSDASFINSLQSRLIGFFDDFGYRRIGIACKLSEEVCEMEGLGSAGPGFTIVEGSGLPRLSVVGFNHRVDWPTLMERLAAASSGDVSPVFE